MPIHDPGRPFNRTIKCAHCTISFWSQVNVYQIGNEGHSWWAVEEQRCPQCEKFNLFLVNSAIFRADLLTPYSDQNVLSRRLIRPRGTNRGPISPKVPPEYAGDYKEACLVLNDSPKASAALSRRCLQHLLREVEKTTAKDLAPQIAEVLQRGKLPDHIATMIDAVRNVGNFAAHPIKSQSTGEIVEVEPGEAELNLEVLESLFDFYFVQPARVKERLDAINQKLADAGKPPIKQPST